MAMGGGGAFNWMYSFVYRKMGLKLGRGGGGREVKGDVYRGPFIFLLFDRKSLAYVTS